MKAKDLTTGNMLESDNKFVYEQWKKNPERFELVEEKKNKKPEKTE